MTLYSVSITIFARRGEDKLSYSTTSEHTNLHVSNLKRNVKVE